MSVVRKYQSGGNAPNEYSDFPQYLNQELEKLNFKSKAERYSGQIPIWEEFVKSGEAAKSFSSDPITKGYNIKPDQASPKYSALGGSENPVRTNLFNQVVVDNTEDMNSVIASIAKKYLAERPTSQSIEQRKHKVGFGKLEDYMKDVVYGGNENWDSAWENKKKELGTDDAVKAELGRHTKDYITWYNNKKANPEAFVEYSLLAEEQEFLASTNDFSKLTELWNKKGTDLSTLWSPKVAEGTGTGTTTTEQDALKADNLLKDLTSKGFSPERAQSIIDNKYTLGELTGVPDAVKNYIKDKKGIVLNLGDKQIVIDPTLTHLTGTFQDPNDNSGSYFTSDDTEGFKYYNKDIEGYDNSKFIDPAKKYGASRPMIGTFDGKKVMFHGNPEQKNGSTYYTNQIIVEDPETKQYTELVNLGGSLYTDPKTGKTHKVDLQQFGQFDETDYPAYYKFTNPEYSDEFSSIEPIQGTRTVEEIEKEDLPLGFKNDPLYAKSIAELKHLMNSGTLLQKWDAARVYKQKTELLKNNPEAIEGILRAGKSGSVAKIDFWNMSDNVNKWLRDKVAGKKHGGTLKFQNGGKYSIKSSTSEEKVAKLKDLRGTISDMTTLDKASLISSGASIIPGLGVVGGVATTIMDAVSDVEKTGKVDYSNLALNLGFTGLSLIGLGGVGAAARTARLAKAAAEAEKFAKIARISKVAVEGKKITAPIAKIAEVSEFGALKSGLEKLTKTGVGSFKNAGLTNSELKALKNSKLVKENVNLGGVMDKTISSKATEALKTLKPPVKINASKLKYSVNTPTIEKSLGEVMGLNPKLVKAASYLPKTLMVGTAATTGLSMAGDIKEGGIESIKQRDLKNLMLTGAGVSKLISDKSLAKNINRIVKKTNSNSAFEAKGVKYDTKSVENVTVPKEKTASLFRATTKKSAEKKNKDLLENFKKEFKSKTGADLPEGVTLKDIKAINSTSTNKGLGKPNSMNTRDYEKALAKVNRKFKEGGVLKFQNAGKLPYNKSLPKKIYELQAKEQAALTNIGGGQAAQDNSRWNYTTDPIFKKGDSGAPVYDESYIGYVKGLNSDWYSKNIEGLTNFINEWGKANPNIAPLYIPKDAADVSRLGLDNKFGPVHDYLMRKKAENINSPMMPIAPSTLHLKSSAKQGNVTIGGKIPVEGAIPSDKATISGQPFSPRNFPKIPVDAHDILNLAAFASANRVKITPFTGVANLPYMPKQFFRQTAPNLPFYDKQAGMLNSASRRLASTSSDMNRAAAIMLTGATQGIGLREKGMLADKENVDNTIAKQMQHNYQVDTANTEIYGRNRQSVLNTERGILNQQNADKIAANQRLQNYLQSVGRSMDRKQQEAKYKDYYNLATSPEAYQYTDQIANLQKEAAKSKADWEEQRAKLGPVKVGDDTWEDTIGKDFYTKIENLSKQIGLFQRKLSGANLAMQLPVSFAKGGSMADKKELIRYRHELSRQERDQREFYKMILKNNEMMLKSLSRIFK